MVEQDQPTLPKGRDHTSLPKPGPTPEVLLALAVAKEDFEAGGKVRDFTEFAARLKFKGYQSRSRPEGRALYDVYRGDMRRRAKIAAASVPPPAAPVKAQEVKAHDEAMRSPGALAYIIGDRVRLGTRTGTVLGPVPAPGTFCVWVDKAGHKAAGAATFKGEKLKSLDDLSRGDALRQLPLRRLPSEFAAAVKAALAELSATTPARPVPTTLSAQVAALEDRLIAAESRAIAAQSQLLAAETQLGDIAKIVKPQGAQTVVAATDELHTRFAELTGLESRHGKQQRELQAAAQQHRSQLAAAERELAALRLELEAVRAELPAAELLRNQAVSEAEGLRTQMAVADRERSQLQVDLALERKRVLEAEQARALLLQDLTIVRAQLDLEVKKGAEAQMLLATLHSEQVRMMAALEEENLRGGDLFEQVHPPGTALPASWSAAFARAAEKPDRMGAPLDPVMTQVLSGLPRPASIDQIDELRTYYALTRRGLVRLCQGRWDKVPPPGLPGAARAKKKEASP